MHADLNGLTAMVTGGGRGIGRGIATMLAQNGARVLIATRTAATGQQVVDEINASGGEARLLAIDLSSRAACDTAVAAAVDAFGGLDILVHNAGIFPFTPFASITDAEFGQVLHTNLHGLLWLTQAALPHLPRNGNGRIMAISSVVGNHSALAGMCSYAASKAGLNGLARNMAVELAAQRITVNVIEPGLTIDDRDPRMPADMRDRIVAQIPLGREAYPSDIAAAALYFASPAAAFVTGQALIVDGGHILPDMSSFVMSGHATPTDA